jgi:cytochrome c oxidase subunit 2
MVTGWPHLSNPADDIFFFILGISVALLFLVTAVMIYFVVRYAKKRNPVAEDVKDSLTIEVLWTVIPTILVLVIFFVGWKGFVYMRTVPADAMPVKVMARQWSWTFEYENGKQDILLRVPVDRPIKLVISSADVLHSLSIPAYRIKEDALPGQETYLWFLPDEPGSYDLFCTEYCGVAHASMITKVDVLSQEDFDAWYQGKPKAPPAKPEAHAKSHDNSQPSQPSAPSGAELITVKGCLACHSIDGSPKVGPTLKGIFGRKQPVLRDGKQQEAVVDERFLKEKLLHPEVSRIMGFPPIMPSQQGQMTDAEIDAVIDYIRDLR